MWVDEYLVRSSSGMGGMGSGTKHAGAKAVARKSSRDVIGRQERRGRASTVVPPRVQVVIYPQAVLFCAVLARVTASLLGTGSPSQPPLSVLHAREGPMPAVKAKGDGGSACGDREMERGWRAPACPGHYAVVMWCPPCSPCGPETARTERREKLCYMQRGWGVLAALVAAVYGGM